MIKVSGTKNELGDGGAKYQARNLSLPNALLKSWPMGKSSRGASPFGVKDALAIPFPFPSRSPLPTARALPSPPPVTFRERRQ